MEIHTLNQQNIDAAIDGYDTVVIDFWAPWCKHCEGFDASFAHAASAHPEMLFGRVNVAEEKGLRAAFEVKSVPTLAIYRDQIMVAFQPGMLPPEVLKRMIDQVKTLDMDRIRQEVEDSARQEEHAEK